MAGYDLKYFSKVEDQLVPGEVFLAGALGTATGGLRRQFTKTGFGNVLGVVASSTGTAPAGDIRVPDKFVLGLTNQRLLFCKIGAGIGHPKPSQVLLAIPVQAVVSIGQSKGGLVSRQITITLRNGNELVIESGKAAAGKWMDDLIEKIQPLIAAS